MDQETTASDIFSLTDQVLSDRLQFVEEIGFGNWGSVWLCQPKPNSSRSPTKIAVKLVHRSKTPTTAARVRSLWNEMKIVREFKNDPHPSIIPFHSFIITPSYALITMTYLPTLIPVEVEESKAKVWFRYLLSGVEFLHKRGVVHNDIKPANILISHKNVPVLVDFGFAEKYDLKSSKAFHSNLSYGTPEYLSPERARGLPHDTRKSDVWSLGVTFFEILAGRTPFENSDGEHFTTKDDLEKYWARTLKGKWVGTWNISKSMETLLRRMVAPNADLRCTAAEAMIDDFWTQGLSITQSPDASAPLPASLRKAIAAASGVPEDSATNTSSVPKTLSPRLVEVLKENGNYLSPSTPFSTNEKENAVTGVETPRTPNTARHAMARTKSQATVDGTPKSQPRKRGPTNLTPIKGSPPVTPRSQRAKENARARSPAGPSSARKPMGPLFGMMNNLPAPPAKKPSSQPAANKRKVVPAPGVLGDMTARARNVENTRAGEVSAGKGSGSKVGERVREWEREKERLREMTKLEEVERERDEELEKEKNRAERKEKERQRENEKLKVTEKDKKSAGGEDTLVVPLVTSNSNALSRPAPRQQIQTQARIQPTPLSPQLHSRMSATPQTRVLGYPPSSLSQHLVETLPSTLTSPETPSTLTSASSSIFASTPVGTLSSATATSTPLPGLPRVGNESGLSLFKQSVKMSIDRTVRLYKSSTLGQVTSGRSTPLRSISAEGFSGGERLFGRRKSEECEESWEDELLDRESKSSLRRERVSTEARADRMTVWVRNVEKVVEDARQNFASSAIQPLSSLPPAPVSRSASRNKSSYNPQLSRRPIPAANQVFHDDGETAADVSAANEPGVVSPSRDLTMSVQSRMKELPATPQRARRATLSTRSPEPAGKAEVDIDATGSPSRRKEKSKSHGNLLQAKITPISLLELRLKQCEQPPPSQRLSAVIDKSLFIAPPSARPSAEFLSEPASPEKPSEVEDELLSSPFHVEPYPARKPASGQNLNVPDTPSRHRLEGVYDRFLMAASGVKRVGKGYQSENVAPVENRSLGALTYKRGDRRAIHSTRRRMPPPVASDDLRKAVSAGELGVVDNCDRNGFPSETSTGTISLVRRAFQAVVAGKTASRRMSRVAV